jgi:tetratricopeptide (TPR) repeat protein
MLNTRYLSLLVVPCLALASCGKKDDRVPAGKPSSEPAPAGKPAVPSNADMTVTSKFPEAIAAFKRGRDLADEVRGAEAIDYFKQALQIDPGFALAQASLGQLTPGAPGQELLEQAVAHAAGVPAAEQAYIGSLLADRRGEHVKASELMTQVTRLAPGEWRAWASLGFRALAAQKWDEAIAEYQRALDANPEADAVYNGLAYAYAAQRKYDDATAAAKKQAELLATEPNPQDTYGEILLMAGRFDEAEVAFEKALALSPKFALAWQGVALARFYRGDWKGGYDALAKGKLAATLPEERVGFDFDTAWAKLGEGKPADAMKQLDAIDASAEAQALPQAWVGVAQARAQMSYLTGNYADAQKYLAQTSERAGKSKLAGVVEKTLERTQLLATLAIAAKQGNGSEADKILAALEAAAKDAPPGAASAEFLMHGLAKWARGDLPGSIAELSRCWADDFACRWELAAAQTKAGDKAGADATWKQIGSKHYRDPQFLYFMRPRQ